MQIQTIQGTKQIDHLPDTCPFCHRAITPNIVFGYVDADSLQALLSCPDERCKQAFIAYYEYKASSSTGKFTNRTSFGTLSIREFSDDITRISSNFEIIYNQAYAAEQQDLSEICGVGYRKALEFLIKDYCIQQHPSDKEHIEKSFLGTVIENYVMDTRIKSVAKRATWLGNDEAHYFKKWEGKNLEDLKKLIDLTIHWIEMEVLTSSFEIEMPG